MDVEASKPVSCKSLDWFWDLFWKLLRLSGDYKEHYVAWKIEVLETFYLKRKILNFLVYCRHSTTKRFS